MMPAARAASQSSTSRTICLVGFAQARVVEPERAGQPAEDLAVRQALAGRLDRGQVERDVVVPVGAVQVEVLGLHRRRQHDVGEARRVGQALLEHDGEEVVAREARVHARVVGVAGGRIRVEDDERRDRRVVELGQRLAEARHVDRARRRRRQVGGHGARGRRRCRRSGRPSCTARLRRRAGSRR